MTRGEASETQTPSRAPGKRWQSLGRATACAVLCVFAFGCRKQPSEVAPDGGGSNSILIRLGSQAATAAVVRPAVAPAIMDPIPPHTVPPLTALEKVGQSIFLDAKLSNPPGTACASCHDPRRAFSGNNGSTTGVAQGSRPGHFGRRNTPSVMYMKYVPAFHFALEDDDDLEESPFGGMTWNGRANTVAEFVRSPLLDPDEMNNKSEAEIAGKLRAAPYAADFAREYPRALESPASAMKALGEALQAFLTSETMSPFTSKFDEFLRGKAQLSALESKGLKAFEDRQKGSCNHCHLMYDHASRPDASLFTTYAYDAVAVPRNRAIAANADPNRYDLGLCERTEKKIASSDPKWCGRFRIPSLRNVAVRERFMHNGAFSSLRDAVRFYATRTTRPTDWYPPGEKFDDVPPKYRGNVNVISFPYHLKEGGKPALSDEEIDAVVAFLQTLTDTAYLPH